jgi:predicted enzyme related to lactoylglutathione lyase
MALHVPPVASETDAIAAFLGQAQDAFRALLHGLTPHQAAVSPSASSLSIGGLVRHVTAVQRSWLASAEAAPASASERGEADVDAYLNGFRFCATDSVDELLNAFDEASAAVLDAVRRLDPDTPVPVPDAPWFPEDVEAWSVRWVWWHLMEELTRHAGHGDIVRETVDGATMYALVAARDGLPDLPFLPVWKPSEPPFTTGVSAVRLRAEDLGAARAWYVDLLGAEPSVDTDASVEWRVGPHEHGLVIVLGLPTGPAGSVTSWEVHDVDQALADLRVRGATVHEDVHDAGGDRAAVVVDPFGNALGVVERSTDAPEAAA